MGSHITELSRNIFYSCHGFNAMIDPDDIDPELLARFRESERRKEEKSSKRKERSEEINQKWG